MGFKQTRLRVPMRVHAFATTQGEQVVDNTVTAIGSVSTGEHPPKFNWARAIYRGESATTELHGLRYYRPKYKTGYMRAYRPTQPNKLTTFTGAISAPSGSYSSGVSFSLLTTARSRATINLAKSVRERQTLFQGGVFTGEIREAVQLFKQPVKAFRGAVSDLYGTMRRISDKWSGSATKVRRGLEVARDTWLEWALAVKPLMSDAESAGKAIAALVHKRTWDLHRCIGTGLAESVSTSVETLAVNNPGYGAPTSSLRRYVLDDIQTAKQRYIACIKVDTANKLSPRMDLLGANLFEFVPTVWELVPRSFLVDYFVNAGDLITAWSLRFVRFSWVVGTTRQERTKKYGHLPYQYVQTSSNPSTFWEVGGGGLQLKTTRIDRLPAPELGFPLPEFKLPDSGTQWLNILALGSAPTLRYDRKINRY